MICGIDEAGRGSVGGSLFVCGVAYRNSLIPTLDALSIKDSKKLSKNQREKIAHALLKDPQIIIHLVQKTPNQIDSLGLSQCLKEALEEIMQVFQEKHQVFHFIYDGNTTFKAQTPLFCKLETLIKGDCLIHQISSASILAKYNKDKECEALHTLYPQYEFLKHSGYCTALHKEKIKELGYTPFHRKSYKL